MPTWTYQHVFEVLQLRPLHGTQELSKRDLELIQVREERGRYRKDALAWRRKTVLTRMRQASAEENAQLATANLVTLEGVVHQLEDEREILLRCNQAMEKQLQALTRLCQGQHRAKIAQQVRYPSPIMLSGALQQMRVPLAYQRPTLTRSLLLIAYRAVGPTSQHGCGGEAASFTTLAVA